MYILCATDLLAKSESAIDRAEILADHLDADLSLLHVVTPPESPRMLAEDLQHASLGMEWRSRIAPGASGCGRTSMCAPADPREF